MVKIAQYGRKIKAVLNYVGQLRIYSFLDLAVFATALSSDWYVVAGICLLWLSGILYLESRHKDEGRLMVHVLVWLVPLGGAFFLLPAWICLGFVAGYYLYTKKKQSLIWGISAPVWRASLNCILAVGFNSKLALLAFVLIFIRNLIADLRDAGDDKRRRIPTLPVALGVHKNQTWAFYGHLVSVMVTTVVWFHFSFLDVTLLLPILIVQVITYPLTPRPSNPKRPTWLKKMSTS